MERALKDEEGGGNWRRTVRDAMGAVVGKAVSRMKRRLLERRGRQYGRSIGIEADTDGHMWMTRTTMWSASVQVMAVGHRIGIVGIGVHENPDVPQAPCALQTRLP